MCGSSSRISWGQVAAIGVFGGIAFFIGCLGAGDVLLDVGVKAVMLV